MKFFNLFGAAMLALLFFLFSASILFIERKFIAIAQRRIGITFLGRNG
jgi:NADH:ubiquinone oxidoreductase subunit H